jgi:hypothetical protein
MLRDVFYYGKKPNVHPREKFASSLEDARQQSSTEYFWVINEFCDYRGFDWDFDFEFLPDEDVWAEEHNNVWPSQHQKDSGTWLCNTDNEHALTIYRADVDPVKRKNIKTDNWVLLDSVNETKFDFSWHPDPTDPPYIYKWGCKFFPAQIKHVLEYHVDGATNDKYMRDVVELNPNDYWAEHYAIDKAHFDFSWRPDPMDSPFIYVWGNKYVSGTVAPTLEYHVPGATERKHLPETIALLSNKLKFEHFEDSYLVDYSWIPDPTAPPYIYAWGNQWNKPQDKISIQYIVEGATEYKYMEEQAIRKPSKDNWIVPDDVDTSEFDFSWEPSPLEPPFIYQFGTQWQKTGGPRYVVEGATETKYVDTLKAKALDDMSNWTLPTNIDIAKFDFSWHPDATSPPYICRFPTQWAMSGGPTYTVTGATEVKYVDTITAQATPNKQHWIIPDDIAAEEFDFSWHPYAEDDPYIYQFGTQWQKTGGPRYITPDSDEMSAIKYIDTRVLKARKLPRKENWDVPSNIDPLSIDYSWHPDDTEPSFVYQFGTQWYDRGGPKYIVPGASAIKYSTALIGKLKLNKENWTSLIPFDETTFDYSWSPHPDDPPFIYVFGNQWHPAELEPTVEYRVEGAIDKKYIHAIIATTLPDMDKWEIPSEFNKLTFDFSWRPNPTSPPYIYQFGSLLNKEDGPRYITPDNTGEVVYLERKEIVIQETVVNKFQKYFVETTLEDLIKQHSNEIFWALNPDLDYSEFNFDWRPTIEQSQYVHAFGSSDSEATQTYLVNSNMWEKGFRELNWVIDKKLDDQTLAKLFKKPDMFFVDKGNSESLERFEKLKQQFPSIQKTRYLNSWVDTINRCINRASTNLCWILNSELDYTDFNFEYYPNPWQMKMVHVFGTQWSHWGTTFMVNRECFAEDTKYIKIIEHLNNINFVKDRRAKATNVTNDIIYIDHGNLEHKQGMTVVKYEESYLKTFKNMLSMLPNKKEHYVWVCSSICDYSSFDFTYICDPFAREQLHVFPSDKQKFGDTFLVNVNKLRELVNDVESLEDFKVNYNQHQRVTRLPAPTIITEGDTHVSTIHTDFDWPYATLVTSDNKEIKVVDTEPMSLWTPESKSIQITSVGGTRIVVPKEAKDHIKHELYDYPYIQTNKTLVESMPMDIVFLSNGETGAEENYEHLLNVTKGLPNRVVRVDGVNGRVQAYHASAEASNTPWAFTVFAKLKVSNKFDWNWQPDRLQIPKHYVFHAKNPVNGLVYGHQAMIAYNKKLTLANEGKGLDFTMDDEHEIVEILSGTANFNTDEYSTWRTAFREALKLRANTDDVSKNRLEFWLTVGSGKFSQYSIDGATDAVQYYEEVNGDFDKLKLSYEWKWLRAFYESKYK